MTPLDVSKMIFILGSTWMAIYGIFKGNPKLDYLGTGILIGFVVANA